MEGPKIFVHEGPWHTQISCGVHAKLGKCLAHPHVGLLHHGVAFPWVTVDGLLTKVVEVVECFGRAPYVHTQIISMAGNQTRWILYLTLFKISPFE